MIVRMPLGRHDMIFNFYSNFCKPWHAEFYFSSTSWFHSSKKSPRPSSFNKSDEVIDVSGLIRLSCTEGLIDLVSQLKTIESFYSMYW